MGRSAVKPDVQNIHDLIVVIMVVISPKEPRLCAVLVPRIRALNFKRLQNPCVYRRITQQIIVVRRRSTLTRETGQWNAPRPLA